MRVALRPLRIPGFGHLAVANVVNELGNWLGEIALAVLVFDQTGDPLAVMALFLAIQFLPAFLAPPLVARLEAFSSRASLAGLYATEGAVFAALGVTAGAEFVLVLVVALAAVDGALASSARALTRGAAGTILSPPGLLREGNALLNVGFTASAAVGPVLAGLVVAGAGVEVALYADAISFLSVALLITAARGLPRAEPAAAWWRERLMAGFRYVRERPVLQRLITAQGAAFVFFYVVIPIEVVFAKETLGAGDAGYGALLGSWGAGMLAGGLLFAALRRLSLGALLLFSTTAIGLAYLGTAIAPTLLLACFAAAIGGTGNGIQWVALLSAVQEMTEIPYQARVIAMVESIASAMPGVGFLIGGVVAALLSPRASYAVAGLGVLAVLAVAAVALRRIGWRGDERAAQAEPDAPEAPAPPPRTTVAPP
jgi:MFS family permease